MMRRWLQRILVGVCLLIAVLSAGLYLLSHWTSQSWTRFGEHSYRLGLGEGRIHLRHERKELFGGWRWYDPVKPAVDSAQYQTDRLDWPETGWVRDEIWISPKMMHAPFGGGISWRGGPQAAVMNDLSRVTGILGRKRAKDRYYDIWADTYDSRTFVVPLLGLSLLASIPVLAMLLGFLAYRYPPQGVCSHCGYDLRCSRDRCPECGRTFAALAKPPPARTLPPVFAACAILLAVAIAFASLHSDPAVICNFTLMPETPGDADIPLNARAPVRVIEAAVSLDSGSLLIAEAHGHTKFINLPLTAISETTVPLFTKRPALEPAMGTFRDSDRTVHVLRLPLWLVYFVLLGSVVTWVRSVRRQGGFMLNRHATSSAAPAAP